MFDAGNVWANEPCAPFNVNLRKFLLLAQFAEPVTNLHRGIIPLIGVEGKGTDLSGCIQADTNQGGVPFESTLANDP
jgi:hypothetical protein